MSESEDRLEAAASALDSLGERDVSLAPFCTYKVGGPAALLVRANSIADLERVVVAVERSGLETLVVGKGSNLLVADSGFDGIAVHLDSAFAEIDIDQESARATLGAAVLLPVAARRIAAESLTGFEWAVGVPGSVGGAVRMNAGGHGSDMAASLTRVNVFDLASGGPEEWTAAELKLGYRTSALEPNHLVLSAELELDHGDRDASEAEIKEIVGWRREHQPGGQNAGSVFTNPPGDSAGRLIDQAGLKGFRIGTASVSAKHANFIQADVGGSADDVHRVIREVRRIVLDRTGLELHCENRLIGFEPLEESGPAAPALCGAGGEPAS